ncbi:trimeric intracellular cation channel family protein [Thalassospira sp.]|uniref:trimeric intracellular cation channel family protein n=1 Tax=Thalassospira sp. TaxID=1912094 RepID=UPI003AA9528F
MTITQIIYWLELAGVAVFAITGALEASRRQMDVVGFVLIATFTGIGGGTVRDVITGATPVFWIRDPAWIITCISAAIFTYFTAHLVERRYVALIWLDAIGLAMFGVTGAAIGLNLGVSPLVAIILGMITATFGGMVRDVVCNEIPLILRPEIYITCAALGAGIYVIGTAVLDLPRGPIALIAFFTAFLLRASAIKFQLRFPVYKTRPGREY